MILLKGKKDLFDFAVNVINSLEKVKEAKVNIISMYMPESKLKYSIRLHKDLSELIGVNDNREIIINPLIAASLAPEVVVHAIIWAHMRPDFPEGISGHMQTDIEALEVITNYYPHFNKETFLTHFDNLCNKKKNNTDRVQAIKNYLDTLPG